MAITLQRVPNWDVELTKYCDFMRGVPVDYVVCDCVLFVAGGIDVQTSADLAAAHRGKYAGEAAALAYMTANGWADVEDVADAFLERVPVGRRRRGDVLMFKGTLGKSLGLCLGREAAVMTGEGSTLMASRLALGAWRVG